MSPRCEGLWQKTRRHPRGLQSGQARARDTETTGVCYVMGSEGAGEETACPGWSATGRHTSTKEDGMAQLYRETGPRTSTKTKTCFVRASNVTTPYIRLVQGQRREKRITPVRNEDRGRYRRYTWERVTRHSADNLVPIGSTAQVERVPVARQNRREVENLQNLLLIEDAGFIN